MDLLLQMYEKLLWEGYNPEEAAEAIQDAMDDCIIPREGDVLGTCIAMAEEEAF